MRVTLKCGQMAVALSKPEAKKLAAAAKVAETLSKLAPVPEEITESALNVMGGVKAILAACAAEEPVAAEVQEVG